MGRMGRDETGRHGRADYMHVLWAADGEMRLTRVPETEYVEVPADEFGAIEAAGAIVRRVDWAARN